jgi:hypothetical protein
MPERPSIKRMFRSISETVSIVSECRIDELWMNQKSDARSFDQTIRHPGHSAVSFAVLSRGHMKRAIESSTTQRAA